MKRLSEIFKLTLAVSCIFFMAAYTSCGDESEPLVIDKENQAENVESEYPDEENIEQEEGNSEEGEKEPENGENEENNDPTNQNPDTDTPEINDPQEEQPEEPETDRLDERIFGSWTIPINIPLYGGHTVVSIYQRGSIVFLPDGKLKTAFILVSYQNSKKNLVTRDDEIFDSYTYTMRNDTISVYDSDTQLISKLKYAVEEDKLTLTKVEGKNFPSLVHEKTFKYEAKDKEMYTRELPLSLTVILTGVTYFDGVFYNVSGDVSTISDFELKFSDGRDVKLKSSYFYLDNYEINPNTLYLSTINLPNGDYKLNLTGEIYHFDSELMAYKAIYPLKIVESADQLPAGAPEIGTYSMTIWNNDYY
ncbi:MAG: hypothetical protein J1E95_03350 [Muribaculaceae bacterium]|nr:hypothetical protein [Muribaculaceae bacterium]